MNRIFRTVWNRVRRQLVAVNESVTGASQASGSTVRGSVVNAQPVNTVGVTLKKSALALAVGSALALSLPAANASWIDDNGGVDGKLTWTVGTQGTTSWNPLGDQIIELLDGESLFVTSTGSNYNEKNKGTTPDMIVGSYIVNHGTIRVNWEGTENNSQAENDSNFIDNYGNVNIRLLSATPGPDGTGSSSGLSTILNGWEIQTDSSPVSTWDSDYAFRNREEATFDVAVILGASNLADHPDLDTWAATVTGIRMSDQVNTMKALNEGTMNIVLAEADANAYGFQLRGSNTFENASTGKIDIDIDPRDGDPALSSLTTVNAGIKLEGKSSYENAGYIHANIAGGDNSTVYVFNSFVNGSETNQSIFTNKGTFEFDANSHRKAVDASTVYAVRIGANDIFDNQGTFSGKIHSFGGTGRVLEIYNSTTPQSFLNTGTFDVTVNANAIEDADSLAMAEGIYLNDGELIENRGTIKLDLNVISNSLTTVGNSYGLQLNDHKNTGGHYQNYGTTSISVSNDSATKGTVYGVISNADSTFYNAEDAEVTLDVSGYYGGGIFYTSSEDLINDGTLTIDARSTALMTVSNMRGIYSNVVNGTGGDVINNGTLTVNLSGNSPVGAIDLARGSDFINTGDATVTVTHREEDALPFGGSGLHIVLGSSLKNSGTLTITGTGNSHVPQVTSNGNISPTLTGLYKGYDGTFENTSDGVIDVTMTTEGSEGAGATRLSAISLLSSGNNAGTITTTVNANYGNVATNFRVYSADGFWINGVEESQRENAADQDYTIQNEDVNFVNTGTITTDVTMTAVGSNLNMDRARGFIAHQGAKFTNQGTLSLKATGNGAAAKGLIASGSEVINEKEIKLDVNGTTATGIQSSYAAIDGANVAGKFVNEATGTVTGTVTGVGETNGAQLNHGFLVNSGLIDLDITGDGTVGIDLGAYNPTLKADAPVLTNNATGKIVLDLSGGNGSSHGVTVGLDIGASGTVNNAGTIEISMENHSNYVKGIAFSNSLSTITNTGSITITGTNYGDNAGASNADWQKAYGIALDEGSDSLGEKFTNEGIINVDVDAMNGESRAIYSVKANSQFNNAATGTINLTVDAHNGNAYGLFYDGGSTGYNDGLIDIDVSGSDIAEGTGAGIGLYVAGGSAFTNNKTITIDLTNSTGDGNFSEVSGILVGKTTADTTPSFNNNGSISITSTAPYANNTSDAHAIRVKAGSFVNAVSGVITLDLGAPAHLAAANNTGIQIWNTGKFENQGTITITPDQVADSAGKAFGIYSVNSETESPVTNLINTGTITITADGESTENVQGIYSTNNITNTGTISTNAAIYANAISGAVGTWVLSGADTESTVLDSFKTGSLTNAGKLTIDADNSLQGTQALWAARIENTGEINTGATYISAADGVVNNYGTINITTAKERIALGLGASQDYDAVVWTNEVGSELNVDLTTTSALLEELGSWHTAGIDMYTPQSDLNAPAAHLINKGTVDIDVLGEKGVMYGIVYDGGTGAVFDNQGTMTIDVTKSDIDTYETQGLSLRRAGQFSNSGTLDINAHSAGGNRNVYGLLLQGADDGSFRVDFTNSGNLILTASTDLVPASTTQENGEAVALRIDDGTFTNTASGSVQADVKSIKTAGIQLVGAGVFDNYGKVSVDLIPVDLTGVQTLGTNSLKGLSIRGTSTFTNYEGGEIEVTLTNDGSVPAQVASLLGVGGEGSANFVNQGTVTLKSEDLATTGSTGGDQVIGVLIGENGTLTNEKNLTVEQKAQYATGMRLSRANSAFVNTGTTEMKLEGIGDTDVGNITALSVQDSTAKLNNQGTLKITLAGTGKNATGILVNNAASTFGNSGNITIDVTGDFVNAKAMDVVGTIANNGSITTNGAIEVGNISGAQGKLGDLILTGADTVSTIANTADVGKLENAGTLNITNAAQQGDFVLKFEELENSGILSTGGYVQIADATDSTTTRLHNTGVITITENGDHRFGIMVGNGAVIENEAGAELNITLNTTLDQIHNVSSSTDTAAVIDMNHYSENVDANIGGQLINKGEINLTASTDQGRLIGIIWDGFRGQALDNQGSISITLTKTAEDTDNTMYGMYLSNQGTYTNSGDITVNLDTQAGGSNADGIYSTRVALTNNKTITIQGVAGKHETVGYSLHGNEAERGSLVNNGNLTIDITSNSLTTTGETANSVIGLVGNYSDFINNESGVIDIDLTSERTTAMLLYHGSTFTNKGRVDIDTHVVDGENSRNAFGLKMREGSSFVNEIGATWEYTYENNDDAVTSAFADAILTELVGDAEERITNKGTMTITLVDKGHRADGKYLNAANIRAGDVLDNQGTFHVISTTNGAELGHDSMINYSGTVLNSGLMDIDGTVLSGERIFFAGVENGSFTNANLIDVDAQVSQGASAIVFGSGFADLLGTGAETVQNSDQFVITEGGRLEVDIDSTGNGNTAGLFASQYGNDVDRTWTNNGTVIANLSAENAYGFRADGAVSIQNAKDLTLTLTGTGNGVLTGVNFTDSATFNNNGDLTINLEGTASEAVGITGGDLNVLENNGSLTVNVAETLDNAKAINVLFANNSGAIEANGSVFIGTLQGEGSLSVTKGTLEASTVRQDSLSLGAGVAGEIDSYVELKKLIGEKDSTLAVESLSVEASKLGDISGFAGGLTLGTSDYAASGNFNMASLTVKTGSTLTVTHDGQGVIDDLNVIGGLSVGDVAISKGSNSGTLTAGNVTMEGAFANTGDMTAAGGITFEDGSSLTQTEGSLTTDAGTVIGSAGHNETDGLNVIGIGAMAPEDIKAVTTELFKIFVEGTIAQDLIDHATFEGGKVIVNLGDTTLTTTQAEALKNAFSKIWGGAELEFIGTVEGNSDSTVFNQETVAKLQAQVAALKDVIYVDRNLQGENGAVTIGSSTGISESVGFAGIDNATSITVMGGKKLVLIGGEKQADSADDVMVSADTTTTVRAGSTLQLGSLGLKTDYSGSMGAVDFSGSDMAAATLAVVNGSYSVGTVTGSNGNVTVAAGSDFKAASMALETSEITNSGTMTVAGDMTLTGGSLTNNNRMTVAGDLDVSGVLTNNGGAFLETNNLNVTGQLSNFGEIEAMDTSTVFGTLENQGEIRLYDTEIGNRGAIHNTATLTQTGTTEVNGLLSNVAGATANFETVNLDGANAVLENTGTITIDKLVVSNGATAVNGILTSTYSLLSSRVPAARENVGELEVQNGQSKTNAAEGYYGAATIAGSFINTATGNAVFGVSDQWADGTGAVIESTGLVSNAGSITFSGALSNAGTINGSGTITMATADGAANTFTNSGTIDVGNMVADGITFTQTDGSIKSDSGWFANSTVNRDKGRMEHDTLGGGNTYNVGSASNASDSDAILDVGTVTSDSVVNINEGGTLAADVINLSKEEKTIHLVGGTLQTNLDQIFEGLSNVAIDIDAEDTSDLVNTNIVTGVGDIKDSVAAGIEFGWGTVAFNDAFYATTAAADVLTKLEANDTTDYGEGKDLEVVFNGNSDVQLTVDVAKTITAQHPEGGVAYATFATELLHNKATDKPDATTLIVGTGVSAQDSIQPADPDAANVIGSMGFKGIRGAADGVWVNSDAHLVLVGSLDTADFALTDGTITVAAGYSAGNAGGAKTPILTLGSYGSAERTMGHLDYVIAGVRDATSTSHTRGEVRVRNGTFTITKADIGGVLSVGGNGTDRPEDHTAELAVDDLTLVGTGTVQNDAVLSIGSVTQRTLTGNGTIRNRGTLTITNGEIFSINNEAEGNLTATNLTILSRGSTNYGTVTAENLTIGGEYRWGVGGEDGLGVRTSGVWADAGTTNVTGTLTVAGLYHLYDGSLTAAQLDLTGTGSLALDVNEVTQAPAGTAQIETLNAADGTTVAVNSGKVAVSGKATLEGSVSTAGVGSITIHAMDLQAGAVIANDGSLTVETDTTIAGSVTGTGNANFAGVTITDGAQIAMTGDAVIDAGAVVVNENGTLTNIGSTTVESLAATNANDIQLGSLTSAGNLSLTGTNMTAALASAQNLSVTGGNLDATSADTTAVEENLTLSDGTHAFSDLTVTGNAGLTNSVLTADSLTVGGTTDISGGSVTVDDILALTGKLTAQNTTIDAATLTVKSDAELTNTALLGSVSVDGSLSMTEGSFEGSLVKAGATTIDSVNDFVSTGASNLASLDADDSTLVFGELTVEGLADITNGSLAADKLTAGQIAATDTTIDIAGAVSATGDSVLTGTDFDAESFTSEGNLTVSGGTFDAALVKAGDVIANNGAQVTSSGASSIASLDADGATLTFGDVTVTGKADVTDGSFAADSLSAGILAGTDTTIDIEGAVSVAGGSTLTNTDFDAATFTSDSTLTVAGGTFDAALVKAGDVTATNGAQLTSTGASTIASLTSNASTVSFGELTVNGAASATGGSLAANTLSAGDLTGSDTSITVTGAATIASLDADNSTLNLGSADVEGLADVTGGSLTTTGNYAAGSITASGTQLTIGGDLTSDGAATLTNTATTAQNVATGDLTVTGGSLTAASITGGNTTVSGGAVVTSAGANTLDKLTASGSEMTMGATTIAGDMELTGGSYAFDSLAVAGNADITDVSGTVTKGDSSFGTMTVDGTSNAAFTGTTSIADALTNAASVTFGTLNITGAAASVTHTGSITADVVSGSGVTYNQTAGSLSMASNGLSDSTLTVTGGTVKTDTLGVGNTWTLGTASTDGASIRAGSDVVMEVGNLTSESIVSINTGANLVAENINLDGTANTVTLAGGTLTTMLDQIFDDVSKSAIDIGAGEPGDVVEVEGLDAVTSVGGIKDTVSTGIALNVGTVAFNDKTYSLSLASDVLTKLEADDAGDLEVLFNGSAAVAELTVDIANGITAKDPDTGSTAYAVFAGETLINKDAAQPDAAYTKLVVGSADPAITDAHNLASSMGFMNVTGVQDGLFIRGEGTEFVLVGADDTMPGIDADNLMLADGAIDVGEGAAMTFGSYGKAAGTKGKFTTVSVDGTLHAKNGTFTGESVTGSGTVQIGDADKVQEAQLIVNTVELTGGALTVAAHGTLTSAQSVSLTGAASDVAGSLTTAALNVSGGTFANSGALDADVFELADGAAFTQTGAEAQTTADTLNVGGLAAINEGELTVAGTTTVTAGSTLTSGVDAVITTGTLSAAGSVTAEGSVTADRVEGAGNVSVADLTAGVVEMTAGSFAADAFDTDSMTIANAKVNLGTGDFGTGSFTDSTVTMTGAVTGSGLSVTGGSINAADLDVASAEFTGTEATLGTSDLGDMTFENAAVAVTGDLTGTSLEMTGGSLTTTEDLGITGLASVTSGTLQTAGLTADEVSILSGSTVTISGAADASAVTVKDSVLTAGSIESDATTVSGTSEVTVGSITVENGLTVTDGTLTADNATAGSATIDGATVSIDTGNITEVSVAGDTTLTVDSGRMDDLTMTGGDVTVGTAEGGFTLGSVAQSAGSITGVGDTAINGKLTMTGSATGSYDKLTGMIETGSGTRLEIESGFELAGSNGGSLVADNANGSLGDFTNTGNASFGNVAMNGAVSNTGSINANDATVKGDFSSNGTFTSDKTHVANGGSMSLGGIADLGNTTVDGSITVTDGITNASGTTVNGSLTANGGTANLGNTTVNGGKVSAEGGSIVAGDYTQTGGSLTVDNGGSFTSGNMQVSDADVTLGNGNLNASGSIDGSNITITGGTWGDNLTDMTGTTDDALGGNDLTIADGTLNLGDKTLTDNGNVAINGGTLITDKIDLSGPANGTITVGDGGTLQTGMDQIFEDFLVEGIKITAEDWQDAWGAVKGDVIDAATNVGDVKDDIANGIDFAGGTISFDDEAYRSDIVGMVGNAVSETFGEGNAKVEFLGHAVDDFTLDTIRDLEADGMADKTDGLIFANDNLKTEGELEDGVLNVGLGEDDDIHMNTGFAGVEDAEEIHIKDGLEFVLTGQKRPENFDPETGFDDSNKLLVDSEDGGKITVSDGTQTIGSDGIQGGTVGWVDEAEVGEDGNLVFKNGEFAVNDITNDGTVHIKDNATDHTDTFTNSGDVIVDGTLDVGDFIQTEGGSTTVGGDMIVTGSEGSSPDDPALSIGGGSSLTVEEGGSLSNTDHTTVVDGTLENNGTTDYKDVDVNDGGSLVNNGTETGEDLVVDLGGEYVNNGDSNWGTVDIDGSADNNGTLVVEGDGDDSTPDLSIGDNGSLVNDGTIIAGGDGTHNDTIVEGDFTNNGNAEFDDMDITEGGHYHNTETGTDKGDSIDVAEGGKWTNDGTSDWGSVNIDGDLDNGGSLVIGDGDDSTDDFHVGPGGSVNNDGKLDASDAGDTVIEGDFTTGDLNPDGTPDDNAETIFDNVNVADGGSLTNNGTESGNHLDVDQGGEYVNNGTSDWGTVNIDGNGENNGDLTITGDGDDSTGDLVIGDGGSLVNNGDLIAGGDGTHNDTIVDGDLTNNGNAEFDDMEVSDGGHYHNKEDGTDKGDNIHVSDGGKWTNDGNSDWGSVNIDGDLDNTGDLTIGDGDDSTDDFHVGPGGSVNNDGKLDASDSGHTEIEGDFTTGEDGETIFDDVTVADGGSLTNNGKEEGDSLVVEEGGHYENNGDSSWNDVVIEGDIVNNGDTNWDNVTIDGGHITVDSGTTDLGDVTMTSGTIVVGNTRPLDEANKAVAKWENPKPIDVDIFVIGNGELALGKGADTFGTEMGAPVLPEGPARLTITTPIKVGQGTIAVGTGVYTDKENHLDQAPGSVHLGDDSFTLISAGAADEGEAAISTETDGATLTITEGAQLAIGNIQTSGDYLIADGFDLSANLDENGNWIGGWDEDDLFALPQNGTGLGWDLSMYWDEAKGEFWVHASLDDVLTLYPDIDAPGIVNDSLDQAKPTDPGDQAINGILTDKNASVDEKTRAINSLLNIAAAGASMQTAFDAATSTIGTIEDRVSFAGDHFDQSGILKTQQTGGGLWVKATGGTAETRSVKSGKMEGGAQTDTFGIVLGADYVTASQNFVFGGAFAYTKSSVTSTGDWTDTDNSVDSYSFSAYGAWTPNESFNLSGHVGYQTSSGEIAQKITLGNVGSASADVDQDIIFGGLRAEYRMRFGDVILVPHAGVRVVHGLSGDYDTKVNGAKAFATDFDSTTTWQLPVGVSVRGHFDTGNGWSFRPVGDISVIPQFGDTEQDYTVKNNRGVSDALSGQFAGDFVTKARLGFELEKDNTTVSLDYGFARGDIDESHTVNATVRFLF